MLFIVIMCKAQSSMMSVACVPEIVFAASAVPQVAVTSTVCVVVVLKEETRFSAASIAFSPVVPSK